MENTSELLTLISSWADFEISWPTEKVYSNVEFLKTFIKKTYTEEITGRNSIELNILDEKEENGVELEIFEDSAIYDKIKDGKYIISSCPVTIEDCVSILITI